MTAAISRISICETRIGKPDDLAFVVDCWAKNDPALRSMRLRDSTKHVRALIVRSQLLIAHVPREPDAILGWAVTEPGRPPCVHYIYVRSVARRQGVASALVGVTDAPIEYSHVAPKGIAVPSGWSLNTERANTK